jgi:hypothetical protein
MPASVKRAPMVTSNVAGEPVAGSCWGATAGPCAGATGASWVGSTVGCVGSGGRIDARGVGDDVETSGVVELDELLELAGTLDDELGTELLELGGTLDEELGTELLELELGGTLLDDELDELDDVYGSLDDVLEGALDDELLVFTIDVLDVWVAEAGPLSTAVAPSTTPIPNTIHPALVERSMTYLRSRQET